MCNKHYEQYRKYGKVLDNNPRTIFDPNEIIEYEDYADIILYNTIGEDVSRTLIDLEDVEKVRNYKWSMNGKGYVTSNTPQVILHRLIMDYPEDMMIDHINHNRLDNRKSNLRICTQQQNNMNRTMNSNNTSGIAGVSWHKGNRKWGAKIQVAGKQIYLGYYQTKEQAVEARRRAELEYFGEYRNQDED